MNKLGFLSLLFVSCQMPAQNNVSLRTDTIKPGFYIPLDSNVISCKVGITPAGGTLEIFAMTGNKLSTETIGKIGTLKSGSVVIYSEITILKNGVMEKSGSVRYVIGNKNSVYAMKDPSIPDTLPAAEIANYSLDKHVYAFEVTFTQDGVYYVYKLTGNGVFGEVKDRILTLPAGTRVWFENIQWRNDDGSQKNMPPEIHVVK